MADDSRSAPQPVYLEIPWLRLFPWLRIFQCPGHALEPKRLILGAAGIALMLAGRRVADRIFPDVEPFEPSFRVGVAPSAPPDFTLSLNDALTPFLSIIRPFRPLFDWNSGRDTLLHAALASLWTILVWGFFGGAISRIAASRLTTGERLGIRSALAFSLRKTRTLFAPMIPLGGLTLIASGLACFGLIYRIPEPIGGTVAGALLFLPLLGGLLMTMILIGLAAGWPLMTASTAVENEDVFDAVSRSYAYVNQRPWHYGLYIAVALVACAFGWIFVQILGYSTLKLTILGLGFGGLSDAFRSDFFNYDAIASKRLQTQLHGVWTELVRWLVQGWLYSYFWTVATAIYLLLRLDVDGTPWSKLGRNDVTSSPSSTGVKDDPGSKGSQLA